MRWSWRRVGNRVVTTGHGAIRIVNKGDNDIASGPAKIIIKRIFARQFMPERRMEDGRVAGAKNDLSALVSGLVDTAAPMPSSMF